MRPPPRAAAEKQRWWEKHHVFMKEHGDPPGYEGRSYSELMASSVFCMALMGTLPAGTA